MLERGIGKVERESFSLAVDSTADTHRGIAGNVYSKDEKRNACDAV